MDDSVIYQGGESRCTSVLRPAASRQQSIPRISHSHDVLCPAELWRVEAGAGQTAVPPWRVSQRLPHGHLQVNRTTLRPGLDCVLQRVEPGGLHRPPGAAPPPAQPHLQGRHCQQVGPELTTLFSRTQLLAVQERESEFRLDSDAGAEPRGGGPERLPHQTRPGNKILKLIQLIQVEIFRNFCQTTYIDCVVCSPPA